MNQQDFFATSELDRKIQKNKIVVGTSGYIFPDWRGSFYPEKLPQSRWLEFYSNHFDAVEINATYYRLPSRSSFQSMAERTPVGFSFWIKVPGEITHRGGDLPTTMENFLQCIDPIRQAGRLKGVLAQYPFSFRPTSDSKSALHQLNQLCQGIPLAVETRQFTWQNDEMYAFFQAEGIHYVIPDLPALPGLPDNSVKVTSNTAYIRFHGRNKRTWNNPAAGDRYDYEYSPAEIEEWLPKLRESGEKAETTFVFFNNCHMGQAIKNAKMLKALLKDQFGDIR